MAQAKAADPTHCTDCGGRLYAARLTLPRAITGDIAFCSYRHWRRWHDSPRRLAYDARRAEQLAGKPAAA